MSFTNVGAVQALLGADYGPQPDGVTLLDLQQFVDSADVIVLRVQACAAKKNLALSTVELEMIERWLACHMYCQVDKALQTKSSGGSSGTFMGQTGMSLDSTRYGQTAVNLDYSGCLSAIGKRQFAFGFHLGRGERPCLGTASVTTIGP